jgi:hypothetical protein
MKKRDTKGNGINIQTVSASYEIYKNIQKSLIERDLEAPAKKICLFIFFLTNPFSG